VGDLEHSATPCMDASHPSTTCIVPHCLFSTSSTYDLSRPHTHHWQRSLRLSSAFAELLFQTNSLQRSVKSIAMENTGSYKLHPVRVHAVYFLRQSSVRPPWGQSRQGRERAIVKCTLQVHAFTTWRFKRSEASCMLRSNI
jgi:hypothetical protein